MIFGAVFRMLSLIPLPLQRTIMARMGLEDNAVDLTARLIAMGQGYRSAYLAREEFRDLDSPADWDAFRGWQGG